MAGRSVRCIIDLVGFVKWVERVEWAWWWERRAEAVSPTSPVPDPNSRMRSDSRKSFPQAESSVVLSSSFFEPDGPVAKDGQYSSNKNCNRLANKNEATQVLCPRLSPVRLGSWRVIDIVDAFPFPLPFSCLLFSSCV